MGRVTTRSRITALAALLCVLTAGIAVGACSSSGGGSTNEACPAHVDLTVHAKDTFRFVPDTLTATAGKVVVKLIDDGSLSHTFEIHGVSGKVTVSGRSTACGTFTLTKGAWKFYCGVPGHEAAGMKGTLTVS